jgi:two-component system chemotaxis response regulator CheB
MKPDPVSVLIVDDSALMRNLIKRIVESDPELSVSGIAMNGKFALQKIPLLNPEVIILDLEMPEMTGIEFLHERNRLKLDIPVVILSAVATKGAAVTMEALALGASDFITKPSGSISEDIATVADRLKELIKAYGLDYRKRKHGTLNLPSRLPPAERSRIPEPQTDPAWMHQDRSFSPAPDDWEKITPVREPGQPELIAIGISTGGPNALRKVFAEIRPDLKIPIVVVQHMPAGFTREFAQSLDKICPLEVKEAAEGDLIKPGRILIAPGDKHLEIVKKPLAMVSRLSDHENVNGHKPSVGYLFDSIASQFQNRVAAVIMTGMGKDGSREIGKIYKEGGMTIAQDEKSCVVYGMPRVAVEHKYIRKVVSLDEMAETLGGL